MHTLARRVARQDRLAGILLFLPVPIVLSLLTRFPAGQNLSPLLALGLILTHRLYARPFALRRAHRRCLWCGGAAAGGPDFPVVEPLGETTWTACDTEHAQRLTAFLSWLERHQRLLRLGILGSLLAYAALSLPLWLGRTPPWTPAGIVAVFQGGVALTVLPVGWLAPRARRPAGTGPPRVPFPLHIQALLGTVAVIWLFRLVGLVWLGLAAWFVASWLAGGKG